jgi:hypothetical protein
MSYLGIFGLITLGTLFGVLVTGICAAGRKADDITNECIIKSQEDIIEELNLKYAKLKLELHTYQLHAVDKGKYPIEGAD